MDEREVLNGIFYVAATGCQWRALPKDLPPWGTVYEYLRLWAWDGTLERIHDVLVAEIRTRAGRDPGPSLGIIDSQSVKGAEKRGARIDPSGYDAAKRIRGKKRHILVDTQGLIIHRIVGPADIQDRHGAPDLLEPVARKCPRLVRIVADAAYRGENTKKAITACGPWRLEIVRRADNAPFKVLPKRWIVERTFAWIGRCRRLVKDFECLVRMAVAFIDLAMIRLMLRRLARPAI